MRSWDEEPLRCKRCGEELESHPVLFHTWTCRRCEIDYDVEGYKLDWDQVDYQRNQENGLV